MTDDQFPHLGTFVKAAELSSFSAAARTLELTQAAISQRIQALESSLDVSLFRRQGGRILLTDAGRRLYTYAVRILDLCREARATVTGKHDPVGGELHLATSSVPGEHLLPALLTTFRARHPLVEVRASVTDSATVLEEVEHGRVHLGLVGGKGSSPHLEYRCFASDEMVLIVPPKHKFARRKRVTLKQLCDEPLILREAGSGSRWCLEQALTRSGVALSKVHVALELGSNEGIKEAVQQGLGLAVLSTHVVRAQVEAGLLHALRFSDVSLDREMFVVWDRRRVLPAAARLFLALLETQPPVTDS